MQRANIVKSQVMQAVAGDEEAFADLVRSCERTLCAAAMAILRNEQDALDAVQDAILLGWSKLDTLRERAFFNTWLTRIVIRTAIKYRNKRRPTVELRELPAQDARRDEAMDVRAALDALDENSRLCAVLYYYEDLSIDQVAQALGMRSGTVKSRLYRARQALRQALEVTDHDA